MLSSLSADGVSGQPAAEVGRSSAVAQLMQTAVADAVNTALLSCVAVTLSGAAAAILCSSNRRHETEEAGDEIPTFCSSHAVYRDQRER